MPRNQPSFFASTARRLPPPLEAAEQASFVQWWDAQFPRVRLYAIPNGTYLFGDPARRAAQMVQLKKQGLRKGVLDLHCPEWRLWIEFKRVDSGRLSKEQIDWIAYLRGLGDTVIVAHGADAAIRKLKEFRASLSQAAAVAPRQAPAMSTRPVPQSPAKGAR